MEAAPEPAAVAAPPPASAPAPRRPRAWLLTLVATALGGGLAGGIAAGLIVWAATEDDGAQAPAATAPAAGSPGATTIEVTGAIVEAAARGRASVVRIESSHRTTGGIERDVGSGVVVDSRGYIVTNAHVVIGTDSLKVILPDGSERQAILLGHDYPFTDVAVLQVSPGGLTPIEAGDSSTLAPGETVVAIGEALSEFQGSVTVGVVSGVNRTRYYDGVVQRDFIQTDAAVNHGNSGGALLNLKGQLVGMPTSVIRLTETGQDVQGVAFALPANRLLKVAGQIITLGGPIPRPSLGFETIDLVPENLARLPRLATDEGAIVSSVPAGSAAVDAGVKVGDIVTMLGDQAITRQNPLLNVLEKYEPGQTVKVVLNRSGRIIVTEVRLVKRS